MSQKMPLISVIMPCYNADKYVFEAIWSILNQTQNNLELIIIDDCSIDNSVSVIESIKDSRVFLIKNSFNYGVSLSLNTGIEHAKGDYIARMDADDFSLPTRFEKQLQFLNSNPHIDICGCASTIIDSQNEPIEELNVSINPEEIKAKMIFENQFVHPTVFAKSNVFKKNRYDLSYSNVCEDYELWLRILPEYKFGNLKEKLLKYRIHQNNVSNTKKNTEKKRELLSKMFLNFFDKHQLSVSENEILLHINNLFLQKKEYVNYFKLNNNGINYLLWNQKLNNFSQKQLFINSTYLQKIRNKIIIKFKLYKIIPYQSQNLAFIKACIGYIYQYLFLRKLKLNPIFRYNI